MSSEPERGGTVTKMKRFFQRRNDEKSSFSANSNCFPSSLTTSPNNDAPVVAVSMPTRKQRMQFLKSVIHHADAVQRLFLVQKQAQEERSSSSNIFGNDDSSAEVNNKCYQRWHQVLQEGLVPMSVYALNLVETTEELQQQQKPSRNDVSDALEEKFFETLEGMEEEIKVMAILARAASLNDVVEDYDYSNNQEEEEGIKDDSYFGDDCNGMEQINSSMKCIAMLLFHVVLSSSYGESSNNADNNNCSSSSSSSLETNKSAVAGYDGRVRHVMKMACVDELANAIVSSVEAYEKSVIIEANNNSDERRELQPQQSKKTGDDGWDIEKFKSFLELEEIGREAIFGTPWKPSTQSKEDKLTISRSKSDSVQETCNSESGDEIIQEQAPTPEEIVSSKCYRTDADDNIKRDNISEQARNEEETILPTKRLLNAKFLATRKFEQIERLVAIDIVRFLMAEEREKKLREQRKKTPKLPLFLRHGEEEGEANIPGDDGANNQSKEEEDPDATASSQYFTASRIQSIKRGAKIATAGLALGTVFAITGGLAAPALAAGIGGIAALTGATTASSTALLAVLATFKAGALLFGAGGGGIAAYKMKKRVAGLSDFEVRRENIEQYMYQGASEEKMKRGIVAMLPQLHTTVAVTGWLRDNDIADFQLAWGIQPTCKYKKADEFTLRIRQMRRFYSIYNPPLVHVCEDFMLALKSRLKKDFSWESVWAQLEQKYGANPDHMIPFDAPRENEVFLSIDEKAMIDGVLNTAKVSSLAKRGLVAGEAFEFNEDDEIADLLSQASPNKTRRMRKANNEVDIEVNIIENELDESKSCNEDYRQVSRQLSSREALNETARGKTQSLQERMTIQREQQVLFLKEKGLDSPKMTSSTEDDDRKDDGTQTNYIDDKECNKDRCPVVWDWNRLYATDLHTVTWESKMLSSLCHIVENLAIEVSSQATKVALQFSVVGAILSAVAIPSALLTATKLIDDPYQIVILRADEAGRELAKCLLQSDERRPVTLVGFSFGARVIYSCLRELAYQQDIWEEARAAKEPSDAFDEGGKTISFGMKRKSFTNFAYDREPASLIADVIFIGLPRVIDKKVLTSCRRVTGGRLVNCYTTNDWLLSLMFVARAGTPCGVKPVSDVPGLENYDVTHFVESHTNYADAIPGILQHVRFSEP